MGLFGMTGPLRGFLSVGGDAWLAVGLGCEWLGGSRVGLGSMSVGFLEFSKFEAEKPSGHTGEKMKQDGKILFFESLF